MNVSDSILVTVAMAIYRPNIEWLKEELSSIAAQTYKHFQVYAWNDDPNDEYDYDFLFSQYLKDIPFRIYHGSQNLGSNKVFEKLTTLVETPYIAYCDQDDVWIDDKMEKLFVACQYSTVTMAFSDMYVINRHSEIIADSITKIRPRQKYYMQDNILEHLLAKNFVTGCTILMPTQIAKNAIPFPTVVYHDWWLAACAILQGKLYMVDKPLIKYRIYEGNQSGILKNITDKVSYRQVYIESYHSFIWLLHQKFQSSRIVQKYLHWSELRIQYIDNPSITNAWLLWKCRNFQPKTVYFELCIPCIPNCLFKKLIKVIQSGNL